MKRWQRVRGFPGLAEEVSFAWLGQAGFLVRCGEGYFLIDPYLSDALAVKYRGTATPHDRMVPAPLQVEDLPGLTAVFCTHRHSDHFDAPTLRQIAARDPGCRFVVPCAERDFAIEQGLPAERVAGVDAGEELGVGAVSVEAIPAAHESLERNAKGENRFLGYVFRLRGSTVYHSGDTVRFDGLSGLLTQKRVDLALLPVNGRGKGVPGNLMFSEAVELCRDAGIPQMVPHHFGLFAFNTVDPGELARGCAETVDPECLLPDFVSHFFLA